MLSDEEKRELLFTATSDKLRKDLRKLSKNRYNPFVVNGNIDMDRLLRFLSEYNAFINHTPKPFRRIIDRNIKL